MSDNNDTVNLTEAVAAAAARRQAATEAEATAKKSQRTELVGDLLIDTQTVVNDAALDHDVKVTRLQAAIADINGQSNVQAASPATAPTGSAPFDYGSLSDSQKQIIDMVVADAGRFVTEPSGAVSDKHFTKLKKDYDAQQPAGDDVGEPSAAPTPAKKATSSKEPKSEATSATAPTAGSSPAADKKSDSKSGFLDRALERSKKVLDHTKS